MWEDKRVGLACSILPLIINSSHDRHYFFYCCFSILKCQVMFPGQDGIRAKWMSALVTSLCLEISVRREVTPGSEPRVLTRTGQHATPHKQGSGPYSLDLTLLIIYYFTVYTSYSETWNKRQLYTALFSFPSFRDGDEWQGCTQQWLFAIATLFLLFRVQPFIFDA